MLCKCWKVFFRAGSDGSFVLLIREEHEKKLIDKVEDEIRKRLPKLTRKVFAEGESLTCTLIGKEILNTTKSKPILSLFG